MKRTPKGPPEDPRRMLIIFNSTRRTNEEVDWYAMLAQKARVRHHERYDERYEGLVKKNL